CCERWSIAWLLLSCLAGSEATRRVASAFGRAPSLPEPPQCQGATAGRSERLARPAAQRGHGSRTALDTGSGGAGKGGAAGSAGGGKAAQRRSRVDAHTRAVGFAAARSTARIHYRRRRGLEARWAHQVALSTPTSNNSQTLCASTVSHALAVKTGSISRDNKPPASIPGQLRGRSKPT